MQEACQHILESVGKLLLKFSCIDQHDHNNIKILFNKYNNTFET